MAFLGGADTRGGSRGALKRAQAWDQGQCSMELEDPTRSRDWLRHLRGCSSAARSHSFS